MCLDTVGQAKEGYSLTEQREEIARYCQENSFNLADVFSDEGISGAKANEDEMSMYREGLLNMLSALRTNDIKYIVCLSTSRLWRSDLVKMLIHKELKKYNVDIKAIDRPNCSIYSSNPNDILVNGMLELLDTYERLEIALKLKSGRTQKAREGGYSGGGVPYGYVAKRGSKVMEIAPQRAEAVRRVFELKAMCPWLTLQEIADTLNEEGYTTVKGKAFQPTQIMRILKHKDVYSGNMASGKHKAIL